MPDRYQYAELLLLGCVLDLMHIKVIVMQQVNQRKPSLFVQLKKINKDFQIWSHIHDNLFAFHDIVMINSCLIC